MSSFDEGPDAAAVAQVMRSETLRSIIEVVRKADEDDPGTCDSALDALDDLAEWEPAVPVETLFECMPEADLRPSPEVFHEPADAIAARGADAIEPGLRVFEAAMEEARELLVGKVFMKLIEHGERDPRLLAPVAAVLVAWPGRAASALATLGDRRARGCLWSILVIVYRSSEFRDRMGAMETILQALRDLGARKPEERFVAEITINRERGRWEA